LKTPVAVESFSVGGYLLVATFDSNGDVRLLVSSTATMALGKPAGDKDGLVEIGAVLFSKKEERQPADLQQQFGVRKARVKSRVTVQGQTVFFNVLGKAALAFEVDW
jgi:hypothetical protein